jgi:glutathione S-transferase
MPTPLRIIGAPGSPYSRKLRAVLRYRRIPHRWTIRGTIAEEDIPKVPVRLMPILLFPGEGGAADTAKIDSTPLIRELEALYPERSVIPTDPVIAFLDALIEDYGDEWLTKAMFHYRWAFPDDIQHAGRVLPLWGHINTPDDDLAPFSRLVSERQIRRLGVVGSNETTAPVIEESYRRFLRTFDAHLQRQPFVLGERPGSADFGLFGQLTQLALFDPTPAAIAREEAPRVIAWCEVVEDLSGLEPSDGGWVERDALPETLRALLVEIGRVYTPFLLGNASALEQGADQVECEIEGRKWVQKPFPYQGKCLRWLREAHAALSDADRTVVDGLLSGTGCEPLFEA